MKDYKPQNAYLTYVERLQMDVSLVFLSLQYMTPRVEAKMVQVELCYSVYFPTQINKNLLGHTLSTMNCYCGEVSYYMLVNKYSCTASQSHTFYW